MRFFVPGNRCPCRVGEGLPQRIVARDQSELLARAAQTAQLFRFVKERKDVQQ